MGRAGEAQGSAAVRTVGVEDEGTHAVLCHHEPSGPRDEDGILRREVPVSIRTGEW